MTDFSSMKTSMKSMKNHHFRNKWNKNQKAKQSQ